MTHDIPLIKLEGISKAFGPVKANQDITLAFQAGRIKSLLGENGAGKSTLMGILAGRLQPDGGRILVDGRPQMFHATQDAIAAGIGMVFAGVPGAGIWAIVILVLAIAQLPPLLVLIPAIIYVFSHESTVVASIFAVWSIIVAFSDAFLKPLLLGRGVDVPTLVILLGAIGGMLMSGILGLFVGAVVLALGYKLMLLWLAIGDEAESDDASVEAATDGDGTAGS